MADEDILYTSVVFKNKKQPQSKGPKKEETIYDEVKIQNETPQESSDSKGLLSEKEAQRRRRYYQKLACCLGTFCTILVLGIIGIIVYLVWCHQKELNELKESKAKNINLTDQISNLKTVYCVAEIKIHNLTMENLELKEKNLNLNKTNQNLEGETRTLKEQIDNMTKTQNELNVTRAQWSIDQYCPKESNVRTCKPCQPDWNPFSSSCYAYNNAKFPNQKNWDEAQQDCKGKVSHLIVVDSLDEKNHVKDHLCPADPGINGYWIGLRAEGNKWKWINGTELANQDWINTTAIDGQCVTSLKNTEWKSMNCTEKNAWICEKKALSVQ